MNLNKSTSNSYVNRGMEVIVNRVKKTRVAFFDRDGVLNFERSYITSAEQLEIAQKGKNLINFYKNLNYGVCIVTNQSAIGRGMISVQEYEQITSKLLAAFTVNGVCKVDLVLTCPFIECGVGMYRVYNSNWRKPNNGMIEHGIKFFNASRKGSILFGDQKTDAIAAKKSKIKFKYVNYE